MPWEGADCFPRGSDNDLSEAHYGAVLITAKLMYTLVCIYRFARLILLWCGYRLTQAAMAEQDHRRRSLHHSLSCYSSSLPHYMSQMPRPPKRPPAARSTQQQYPSTAYIHSYEASLTCPESSSQTETGGLIRYAGEVQGDYEIWADRWVTSFSGMDDILMSICANDTVELRYTIARISYLIH